jgi:xylose isomerase
VSQDFFVEVPEPIRFAGLGSTEPLAYKVYEPDRLVLGKRMEDHLRVGVCLWHSFAWPGIDMFGAGTMDRPWLAEGRDPMEAAREKMAVAFEFLSKLGVPYYCFHDRDVAPDGDSFSEFRDNLDALADDALGYQERTGATLLWGTANLFTHPRYQAGAATNPDPEVFAYAAAQVKHMLEVTKRLGGTNYTLWGGREGYDTLLNTDLGREGDQFARFLHLVVEHKHKIGFEGTLLIEPKPMEPTKHQYDYDTATVHGFMASHGLEGEYKVNIEANHATLAGHSFHHEVAYALANDMFGSIDANRGDPQNGWDTDQFPNSVEDLALPMYEIVRSGGFTTGGFNFDAKLRRQSIDRTDLFHAHIGGIDTLARALVVAADMIEDGGLDGAREARYAGWSGPLGRSILDGQETLASLEAKVASGEIDPRPVSGGQERLENVVNRHIWSADR